MNSFTFTHSKIYGWDTHTHNVKLHKSMTETKQAGALPQRQAERAPRSWLLVCALKRSKALLEAEFPSRGVQDSSSSHRPPLSGQRTGRAHPYAQLGLRSRKPVPRQTGQGRSCAAGLRFLCRTQGASRGKIQGVSSVGNAGASCTMPHRWGWLSAASRVEMCCFGSKGWARQAGIKLN